MYRQDLFIGKLPVNTQLSAYYNVMAAPDNAANWQIRAQVQLMFPKKERRSGFHREHRSAPNNQ